MVNEWQNKTLENLEKKVWPSLDKSEGSYLVKSCHSLRKKLLKDFTVEDLRIMIGQNIGLKFLIPMAIDVLKINILAEGDLYEGDLLKSVLTTEKDYWADSYENWKIICNLFEINEPKLKQFETTREIREGLFDSYKQFSYYGK